jgi:predicted amidophosphoribosyltransferase
MAPLVVAGATLVSVPRIVWREIRYGIDPADVLTARIAALTGFPRSDVLVPQWLGGSQARRSKVRRIAPFFRTAIAPEGPLALVDDVVTTGRTALSAWHALGGGPATVISATSVSGSKIRA